MRSSMQSEKTNQVRGDRAGFSQVSLCPIHTPSNAQQGATANDHIRHAACFGVWGIRLRHGRTRRAGCGRG